MIEFEGQVEEDGDKVVLLDAGSVVVRVYKNGLRECMHSRGDRFGIEAEDLLRLAAEGPEAVIPVRFAGSAPAMTQKLFCYYLPAASSKVKVDYKTPQSLIRRSIITVPNILISEQPDGVMTIPRALAESVARKRIHGVTDLVALGGIYVDSDRLLASLA